MEAPVCGVFQNRFICYNKVMAPGFMGDFLDRAADLLRAIRDGAAVLAGRVKERLDADPKLKLISAAAILGAVLVILGIMLFLTRNGRARRIQDSETIAEIFRVELPPEELFLDDEPDFLPEVLLERERRDEWNADDARPYWTDPGDEGIEVYEDMMGSVVDGIMERVP
jgi:hypothetical protein